MNLWILRDAYLSWSHLTFKTKDNPWALFQVSFIQSKAKYHV